jgi:hypothetical protein
MAPDPDWWDDWLELVGEIITQSSGGTLDNTESSVNETEQAAASGTSAAVNTAQESFDATVEVAGHIVTSDTTAAEILTWASESTATGETDKSTDKASTKAKEATPPEYIPPKITVPDIPKALQDLWKGIDFGAAIGGLGDLISILPKSFWDLLFSAMSFYIRDNIENVIKNLELKLDQESPGWRAKLAEAGLIKSPIEPVTLTGIGFASGFILGFLGAPFYSAGRTFAWNLMPINQPGASDLVRMELREVFKPKERAEQLIPPPTEDFKKYMRNLGYNDFWADSYWAAHWDLPSITQGYEMFHRLRPGRVPDHLVFTRADLEALMRRQDILPAYIPKLIEIAYTPFTRVDVRRMYAFGILSRDEVKQAYLDLGYDEYRADKLTEFTVLHEAKEEKRLKELSLTDMERAVAAGAITPGQFEAWLREMGYSERAIKIELKLEALEREKKKKELGLVKK